MNSIKCVGDLRPYLSYCSSHYALLSQTRLSFHCVGSEEDVKRTTAELQMAVLTDTSTVPLAVHVHDRLSPTIRKVFPTQKSLLNTILHPQKLLAC